LTLVEQIAERQVIAARRERVRVAAGQAVIHCGASEPIGPLVLSSNRGPIRIDPSALDPLLGSVLERLVCWGPNTWQGLSQGRRAGADSCRCEQPAMPRSATDFIASRCCGGYAQLGQAKCPRRTPRPRPPVRKSPLGNPSGSSRRLLKQDLRRVGKRICCAMSSAVCSG